MLKVVMSRSPKARLAMNRFVMVWSLLYRFKKFHPKVRNHGEGPY